jgi:hypothetical protein
MRLAESACIVPNVSPHCSDRGLFAWRFSASSLFRGIARPRSASQFEQLAPDLHESCGITQRLPALSHESIDGLRFVLYLDRALSCTLGRRWSVGEATGAGDGVAVGISG